MAIIPQDLTDRIRRLEAELRMLTTAANRRPAMNQVLHGDVKIGEGGSLSVRQPGGRETFRVGEVGPVAGEHALVVRRRDGSEALSVWNGTTAEGQAQALRIKDAQGNELLSEDVVAGGLARPHLPVVMTPAQGADWPSTKATDWTDLQVAWPEVQHPRMEVFAQALANGAGGDIRITVDGQTVASGSTNKAVQATFKIPNYTFGAHPEIKLQARAKANSTVWACVQRLYGVAS
ncbi:hypothetical protein SAZ_26300 [Streptomyces noursei ZPM]|uniref:Uncharacterized protein n=1 Tax=Streptomyces noursei TaxID=1971 RepID=A0A401R624_STRNR|nr:hypothetical protein [Streptomyces noursei]AKA05562.1 hypothetical protein SAZ_26300 [Streptomyces noursei ZPM]EOT05130.1 hypothetical protein K530_05018 [Streptomyces noursei CCRC 11814]EXU90240.1 hypothetical protein P354_17600 [Streptomyces noursei PD-1]UWS73967.1 hypothetical protein N1H47_23600 [Streptomyces noursei]GCB93077.1 hypothetical protein SALB_05854 [Streptomyces noursei]